VATPKAMPAILPGSSRSRLQSDPGQERIGKDHLERIAKFQSHPRE
jgi:hypothetical protein